MLEIAARCFGHEPEFREALLAVAADAEVWTAVRHARDDGGKQDRKGWVNRSWHVETIVKSLAANPEAGALETLEFIARKGRPEGDSRVPVALAFARRYVEREAERGGIVSFLADDPAVKDDGVLRRTISGWKSCEALDAGMQERGRGR